MASPPMTRCECAALAFKEVALIAEREGLGEFELLCARSGCAVTCTACKPDLRAFLQARAAGAARLGAARIMAS
ncbi:MAG: hypothetical protein ACT4PV_05715 [Planctomycetaceae bacterium]